jgi:hypothetical protein
LLALLLAACAAPSRPDDDTRAEPVSGPSISIGGGFGNYVGTVR